MRLYCTYSRESSWGWGRAALRHVTEVAWCFMVWSWWNAVNNLSYYQSCSNECRLSRNTIPPTGTLLWRTVERVSRLTNKPTSPSQTRQPPTDQQPAERSLGRKMKIFTYEANLHFEFFIYAYINTKYIYTAAFRWYELKTKWAVKELGVQLQLPLAHVPS